ncbi:type VII secretion protein EssC [Paenibacillus sp. TRM 82003]|nr:type VII secretion protein EssC [Paenibacillus sp. TRM 82003]
MNEWRWSAMGKEFSRQPRFLPEMPAGEIEVPNPPNAYEKPEISWFTVLAPPAVMLVVTALLALTAQSMFLMLSIATTIMTLLIAVSNAAYQIRKYNKQKKERERKYLQFIADTRGELALAVEKQRKAMNEMNPEPEECIRRIMQTDSRLWERTPSFNDFLALRVGVGSAPLSMKIQYMKQAVIMESDPLLMEPQRLALEYSRVTDVPVAVPLMTSDIVGVAGEEEKTADTVAAMLLQLAAHHGYDDVRIVVLSSEEGLDRWKWLRHLPHLWDDGRRSRFLLCGKAMAHQTLSELYALLKERESKANEGSALPHFVFVVEDASLLENEAIHRYLYNGAARLGVSSIFMAKHSSFLPMNCKSVVVLQGKNGDIIDRVTGEKTGFAPDSIDRRPLDLLARTLAALRMKPSGANFALPSSITLMGMMDAELAEDVDVVSHWARNKTYRGMSVPIGATAGGAPFYLDMHETGHGPHGLVAGTTGSGKSELLQSLVISLAIHYHPHDVAFVLIDYKGGGMADVFHGMPHLVGTITNLGGNQTTRALLSIKSELMRRQRIFSEYSVNNIDKYQKLYHSRNDARMPAVPHLIMIADEFAELKQDQPDFMKELVSAARVGRSLGVHLILATQKPAGVVDEQIWSNSKFKLCLKVQDEADSKDVIKRPDAAHIKEPGRAYIQVGNDEVFEMFQSAYSGADYDPEGELRKSENRAKRIYRVALNGKTERIYPLEEEKIAKAEAPSQLQAMVERIVAAAKVQGIAPLEGPWLPPLPEVLRLDELPQPSRVDARELLTARIGIADDPRGQRQEAVAIDLASEGNLFVYGASGTGKTTLLKTLIMSIAMRYTPDEANLYLLDFGGTSLRAFEALPHCGGVMTLEQETRIHQFMLFLFRTIEERKERFEHSGHEGFLDYQAEGRRMPAIVVVVDNYFALSETYETVDDRMNVLAREGFKYGIYLVATATNATLVRYKFSVNFKMAVSLQLIEKGEYDGIVGRTEGLEPMKTAGRGLVRGKPPLEFQTALPELGGRDTQAMIEELRRGATSFAAQIPVMPASIDIRSIQGEAGRLAVGLADHDLQPVALDLYATPIVMIAGEAMSGKSTLICSWIKTMGDAVVYAIDSNGMGLYDILELPYVTDLTQADMTTIGETVDRMQALLDDRRRELIECKRIGGDVGTLVRRWPQIVFAIDRFSEFTNEGDYALRELVERIIKKERGMKVAVIAGDNVSEFAGNWDGLGKAIREEQTGVLLGSIKDQTLYNVKVPYGTPEKDMEPGDGYFIAKHKYVGLRFAADRGAPVVAREREREPMRTALA